MQPFIVIGDKTSHGGTVIGGATTASTHSKQIARVGDKVTCPKCGGSPVIASGDSTMIVMGQPVARHGDKTSCGATLIAGQTMTFSDTGGGAGASAVSAASPTNAQLAQAISTDPNYMLASTAQAGSPAPKKQYGEPSGFQWVPRYPTSTSTSDLTQPFGANVDRFLGALKTAGASVSINATLRPPERAYLMHWSWEIVHGTSPTSVPAGPVNIDWAHHNAAGQPDLKAAQAGAKDMVDGYGLQRLRVAPALHSRHIAGEAIDMSISWPGTLSIVDGAGKTTTITSEPRTGMNSDLGTVGASYGVQKFVGGAADIPHWSSDGH